MSIFVPFRITYNNQFTMDELNKFFNNHTSMKAVFELSQEDVPHYHGFSHGIVSKSTVVNWLKTELHCVGNKDYSMSSKDLKKNNTEEGYYNYICKGTKQSKPKIYKNLDDKWVEEHWLQYWITNEKITTERREGGKNIRSDLLEYVKQDIPYEHESMIIHRILKFFDETDKMVSNAQVENYYHYVRTKISEDYMTKRGNSIYAKMLRWDES